MADVATSKQLERSMRGCFVRKKNNAGRGTTRRAVDGKVAYRAFRGGCHRQNKLIESEKLTIERTEYIGWIHLSHDVIVICRMSSPFSLRCAPLDLWESREASVSRFTASAMRELEQPRVRS